MKVASKQPLVLIIDGWTQGTTFLILILIFVSSLSSKPTVKSEAMRDMSAEN